MSGDMVTLGLAAAAGLAVGFLVGIRWTIRRIASTGPLSGQDPETEVSDPRRPTLPEERG